MSRARRISDKENLKKRVKNYEISKNAPADLVRKWTEHPKMCSCWICGNPRRGSKGKDKLTIQEKRSNDAQESL